MIDLPEFLKSQDLDAGKWHIYIYIYSKGKKYLYSKEINIHVTVHISFLHCLSLPILYLRPSFPIKIQKFSAKGSKNSYT